MISENVACFNIGNSVHVWWHNWNTSPSLRTVFKFVCSLDAYFSSRSYERLLGYNKHISKVEFSLGKQNNFTSSGSKCLLGEWSSGKSVHRLNKALWANQTQLKIKIISIQILVKNPRRVWKVWWCPILLIYSPKRITTMI